MNGEEREGGDDAGCLVFMGALSVAVGIGYLVSPGAGWLVFGLLLLVVGCASMIRVVKAERAKSAKEIQEIPPKL